MECGRVMGKTINSDDSFYVNQKVFKVVMRITCPTCATQYDVDDSDISEAGQDVQCTECMTIWTQTRSGDATNPRKVEQLAQESNDSAPETDAEELDAAKPVEETASEDAEDDSADVTAPEDVETEQVTDSEEPAGTTPADDADKKEPSEDPIWDEIADETTGTDDSTQEYAPPDATPPIQDKPETPQDTDPGTDRSSDNDRPWAAEAEFEKEGLSDFVWSDPATNDEKTDADDKPADAGFTAIPEKSSGELDAMDDDLIAEALNEQIAIEDELENAPQAEGRDIANIPVELGGPRSRIPNVEALKNSVRSKNVTMTKEELEAKKPARRFRRGFTLAMLAFVILAAAYITRAQIVELVPAMEPALDYYANGIDILRANAEIFGANIWELMTFVFDWVMVKIEG